MLRIKNSWTWSRWVGVGGTFALLVMIGCGTMDGSGQGGCTATPGNTNDNVSNDNDGGNGNQSNVNSNTGGNDNVPSGNTNANANGNQSGGNGNQANVNSNTGGGNGNQANVNNNTGGNANGNQSNGNANSNANANGNTNGNGNTGGGGGGGGGGATGIVSTTSTGPQRACSPPSTCNVVTLGLTQDAIDAGCGANVQWSQNPNDVALVTLAPGAQGSVTFTVPSAVDINSTTTTLHFNVLAPGCAIGATGTADIELQTANPQWANTFTCLEPGDSVNLLNQFTVTGQPTFYVPVITIEDNDAVDFTFNDATCNVPLTPGYPNCSLTINAGIGEDLMIQVLIAGTAGPLATASVVIPIQNTCP